MVSPHAGDLVEQRLIGMAVLGDVDHREVRCDVGVHQRRHGQRNQGDMCEGRVAADRHPGKVAASCSRQRHHGLHQRDAEGQNQCEVAEFGNHRRTSLRIRRGREA